MDWVVIKILIAVVGAFAISEGLWWMWYKDLKKRKENGEVFNAEVQEYYEWLDRKFETQKWDWIPPEEGENSNSSLEGFSIIFENLSVGLFDYTSINIFINFLFISLIFSIFISNSLNIKKNINVINFFTFIFNFFFNIFKTLILSIRLERFFIFLLSIFYFILFQNLGGFSLYEVSFTSHAIITLFLSFIIFFNYVINYVINFNELSYEKFVQKNLHIILVSILFVIEFVSFFVRPFSLGVRLFANILSGHILMHIFFNAFLAAYKMFFWLSFFLLAFCMFILTMELFVSSVQSYIFFILAVIYLQDVSKIHP